MKQTAVEWLEEMITKMEAYGGDLPPLMIHIQQAKEMEKQQKLEVFIEGYKQRAEASNKIFDDASRMYAIHLYNETFNK